MKGDDCSRDDGISGFGLIHLLWDSKWVVLFVTLVVSLVAVVYVFTLKPVPVYEAAAFIVPPTKSEIESFNYGRTKDVGLSPLKVEDVYGVFLNNLRSEELRQGFIKGDHFTAINAEERQGASDSHVMLSKNVTVSQATRDIPGRYMVVVQASDPARAMVWAKEYVDRAAELAKEELVRNISVEVEVKARSIQHQIDVLRESSRKAREDSITRLREALRVAEAVGLERPLVVSGNPAVESAGRMDPQAIYMRGSKALKAEIKSLESRQSDDPFIRKLRGLEAKYSYYKELQVSPVEAAVYRLDGGVRQSSAPVKPKKALMIVLGAFVGFMLGTILALVLYFLRKNWEAFKAHS